MTAISPEILALIEALAASDVADYMSAQAAQDNGSGAGQSERPAYNSDQQAA